MHDWHLAQGFRYAGVHSGIRPDPNRLDLALVVSDRPAVAAGVFTQNRVQAAPVRVCRQRLPRRDARGIVICSGNANACTGQKGLQDAYRMTNIAAEAIGCHAEQMLVCSTGVIGRPLPMNVIEPGIRTAAKALRPDAESFDRAAHAILTTDTRIKVATHSISLGGGTIRLTGFAKGAAMIGPNMATMLAFVLTDASVGPEDLSRILQHATARSFHSISVEGHTSTNDTLIMLASGNGPALDPSSLTQFQESTTEVCTALAKSIAEDAEGASHLITLTVEGCRTEEEARRIAKTVAESALVKTAVFGADPNWGRIVSAAGYAGVEFEEEQLSLWMGDLLLYRSGVPQEIDLAAASSYLRRNREVEFRLVFTLGTAGCRFWTCDLTNEYVRLNADYTT